MGDRGINGDVISTIINVPVQAGAWKRKQLILLGRDFSIEV